MKPHPAMALLEYEDIPTGLYVADRVIKRAPIGSIRHGTISGGHYLVLFTGSTASVYESWDEAHRTAEDRLLDAALLPDIHESLHEAILHASRKTAGTGALATLESSTVAGLIEATDRSLKAISVDLLEIRLADPDLQGKSIVTLHGLLHDIEEAAATATDALQARGSFCRSRILTAPHPDLSASINQSTSFSQAPQLDLEGE